MRRPGHSQGFPGSVKDRPPVDGEDVSPLGNQIRRFYLRDQARDPHGTVSPGYSGDRQVGGEQLLEQHRVQPNKWSRRAEVSFLAGFGDFRQSLEEFARDIYRVGRPAHNSIDITDLRGAYPVVMQRLRQRDRAAPLPVLPSNAVATPGTTGYTKAAGILQGRQCLARGHLHDAAGVDEFEDIPYRQTSPIERRFPQAGLALTLDLTAGVELGLNRYAAIL